MEKRPKIGVGVIVIRDNKVLLQKRKNSHGEGTWSLPGGHLEFKESLTDCAQRETEEELGVKIKNLKFATITNDIFMSEDKHYITIFMLSEYESGEPKIMEPGKCEACGWYDWDHLPKPLFLPMENLLKQNYNPLQ